MVAERPHMPAARRGSSVKAVPQATQARYPRLRTLAPARLASAVLSAPARPGYNNRASAGTDAAEPDRGGEKLGRSRGELSSKIHLRRLPLSTLARISSAWGALDRDTSR